jgi:F-type H+-transporting ATPase subunit b
VDTKSLTGGKNVKLFDGVGRRVFMIGMAAVASSLLAPALAFAAENAEAEEEGSSGLALLIPNLGEVIPMLVGFIILWIILAKFAWPTITGMLDKRVSTIKDSLEKAEQANIESERLLAEHKAQLDEAKKQAAEIVSQAKQTGESIKTDITTQAHAEADAIIAKAKAAIEAEKKTAIAELQGSAADLTIQVAKKVIGKDLSDAEHKDIIERYIAEAGSFNDN